MSKIKFFQMIGRGTRLCPTLSCCDGENGIYQGKKYFYIFDWLRNFEFFRMNKEGVKATDSKSLSEVIFCKKVELIKELQSAEYQTPEYEKFRTELVQCVHNQIISLNSELTSARLEKQYVLKYKEIESLENLNETDVENLQNHIAHLVFDNEEDEDAKGFDNLIYSLEVAKLQNKNFSKISATIKKDANTLLHEKATISKVKEQIPLLSNLTEDEYYVNASILDLEEMRKKIRDLIKFLNEKKLPRYTDFIDNVLFIGEDEPIFGENNFEAYEKKVNSYINSHLDDATILKLRNNVKLTQGEYDKLNEVFTKELGSEEQFKKLSDGKPLGVFVRSIAKMDRKTVQQMFADFISEYNLNIQQIEFVKVIAETIIEQGEINLERLGDGKPPFDRPGKLFTLFGRDAQKKLISIIRTVNDNARIA